MHKAENFDDFQGIEETRLDISTSEGGKITEIRGRVRKHDVWVQRDMSKHEVEYTAQIDNYAEITGDTARDLFDKYYAITKYKARL